MTLAAGLCAICTAPLPELPLGPRDAECCAACWLRAGSYRVVRLHSRGPQVGDECVFLANFRDEAPAIYPGEELVGECVAVNVTARTATICYGRKSNQEWDVKWTDLL